MFKLTKLVSIVVLALLPYRLNLDYYLEYILYFYYYIYTLYFYSYYSLYYATYYYYLTYYAFLVYIILTTRIFLIRGKNILFPLLFYHATTLIYRLTKLVSIVVLALLPYRLNLGYYLGVYILLL
ncbi:hypothetical protein IWX50DRAFT_676321 [Phyllosticta citricarpa]|uniref:Uncharacterized protein n=1 Tax=Phyllosticta citricarpa TaxID=55181 RepID=A0ABR1MPK0_9PEZI